MPFDATVEVFAILEGAGSTWERKQQRRVAAWLVGARAALPPSRHVQTRRDDVGVFCFVLQRTQKKSESVHVASSPRSLLVSS